MQQKIHGTELNFDEWRTLAETDPEAFERRRREVLEAFIDETPADKQAHLRRLQWRIDMERRYHWRNPLVATQRLFDMMWESVYGGEGLLPALQSLTQAGPAPEKAPKDTPRADVVRFEAGAKRS